VSLDMSGTKSIKLTAEVEPATASNKKIKWTNGNSNIVYMSASGGTATITGLKNGETKITAAIEGTNISKECKIHVTTSPKSVELNKSSANLDMSGTKTVQLTATVEPSTAQNKTITWSSSNTSIAEVDKNGKVTAKKNGKVTVTAKTVNNKTATSKITVITNSTGIKLNKTSITIDNGKSTALTATILPTTATSKTISWSSSNTSIATVDKNGKVTGKKVGTVTIKAKTSNDKYASCKVEVKTGALGFSSPEADKLGYIQQSNRGYPIAGGSTNPHMYCDSTSLTHAIILLTGNYKITPNSLYNETAAHFPNTNINTQYSGKGASLDLLFEYCKYKYGMKRRTITDRSKYTTTEVKKILSKKHVILTGGGGSNLLYCKPNGKERTHEGHTIMFYKYENGVFYAKDTAYDGGGMCPYTEAKAANFFRNVVYIVEYYI
ncbi:MAG: Ig domain-containing protein, partial [Clostridia bacterium]|nr:Ig domain-containing protein [Clostridia bacterium]